MNTSSRMESTSRPGCIQVSESTYAMLEEDQRSLFEATGGVEVKGKGLMPTYIYQPTEEELKMLVLTIKHGGSDGSNALRLQRRTSVPLLNPMVTSFHAWSPSHSNCHKSPKQESKRSSLVSPSNPQLLHPSLPDNQGFTSRWNTMKKISQDLPRLSSHVTTKQRSALLPNIRESSKEEVKRTPLMVLGEGGGDDADGTEPILQHRLTSMLREDQSSHSYFAGRESSGGWFLDLKMASSKEPSPLAVLFRKATSRLDLPPPDEEEEDELMPMSQVQPVSAPLRRKPVRRNTLEALSAALSNLQTPLP